MSHHAEAIEAEFLALCGLRPFDVDLALGWTWQRSAGSDGAALAWLLIHPDGHPAGEVRLACTSAIDPEFGWLAYGYRRLEGWSNCMQDAMIGCADAVGARVVRHD